jgi:hypothetical protein
MRVIAVLLGLLVVPCRFLLVGLDLSAAALRRLRCWCSDRAVTWREQPL